MCNCRGHTIAIRMRPMDVRFLVPVHSAHCTSTIHLFLFLEWNRNNWEFDWIDPKISLLNVKTKKHIWNLIDSIKVPVLPESDGQFSDVVYNLKFVDCIYLAAPYFHVVIDWSKTAIIIKLLLLFSSSLMAMTSKRPKANPIKPLTKMNAVIKYIYSVCVYSVHMDFVRTKPTINKIINWRLQTFTKWSGLYDSVYAKITN